MSTAMRRTYLKALTLAECFRALIRTEITCERFEFAGSFRRKKPDVGDIDIVAIPKFADIPGDDMFATVARTNLLWRRVDDLMALGTFAKHIKDTKAGERAKWGGIVRAIEFEGCAFEIELCTPDNWALRLAVRTGPEQLSKYFVDPRYGLPARGYVVKDGFYIYHKNGGLVPAPTEQDVFRMAGLAFKPPEER